MWLWCVTGDSLDYFSAAPFIPTDLSVTGMAAFSSPLPATGWKEGRSERERERAVTHSHYPLKWKSWKCVVLTQTTHTHTHTHERRGSPGAHLECHHVWCALSSSQSESVEPQIFSQRRRTFVLTRVPNCTSSCGGGQTPNGDTLLLECCFSFQVAYKYSSVGEVYLLLGVLALDKGVVQHLRNIIHYWRRQSVSTKWVISYSSY